jgi:IPT/TIG domain-containing protein
VRTRGLGHRFWVLPLMALTLVILGAPVARAAAPTISSFSPTSGPIGTSVTVTGTGFQDTSVVNDVEFNNTNATFTVNSDTQITATVPTGATDGPIEVTDSEGTATSASNFDVTPSPVPTITSFTPASGQAGTSVIITGTGFTGATSVTFDGVTATFTVNSDTQITATVPATASTGPIAVTTPGGTATSSATFTVDTSIERIQSRITMRLRGHLIAKGVVTIPDGTDECVHRRFVKIQRRSTGKWRVVGFDITNADGFYRLRLQDQEGRYRAVVKKNKRGRLNLLCAQGVSRVHTHRHPDDGSSSSDREVWQG